MRLMKRASVFYRKFTIICLIATLSGLLMLYYSCKEGHSQSSKQCVRLKEDLDDNLYHNAQFMKQLRSKNSRILAAQYQDLLPHLKFVDNAFIDPIVWLRAENLFRSPPQFVLGIPTTHRQQANYLSDTLTSLLKNLAEEELHLVQFVIMIAERNFSDPLAVKFIAETTDEIKTRFAQYFEEGIIEIISPPTEWYPNLDSIVPTFNDSQLRTTWRAKQSLDYAFLMLYSTKFYSQTTYFVQLEDDIITVPNYITGMKTFAESRENWVMLEFSNLGFIGKLFKQTDLFFVTQFILLLYQELPVDWILDQLFDSKYCPRINQYKCDPKKIYGKIRIKRKPALFQHKGKHSSLPGKIQKLTDNAFSLKSAIQLQKTGNPWPVELTGNVGEGKEELYNTSKPLHIYNVSSQDDLWFKLSYTQGVEVKGVEVLYSVKFPNITVDFVPTRAPLKASFYCFSLEQCVNKIDVETQTDSEFTYMFDSVVNLTDIYFTLFLQKYNFVRFTFTSIKLFV